MGQGGLSSTPLDREVLRAAMVAEISRDIDAVMDALFEAGDDE